jgi:hypothetical protein
MLFLQRQPADFQHSGWRFLSLWEESIVKAWSRPTRRHPSGQYGAQRIDGSIIGGELEFVAEE